MELVDMLDLGLSLIKGVKILKAGVVELVDTLDLGSNAAMCGSSSLPTCTKAEEKSSAFFIQKTVKKSSGTT